MTTSSEFIWRRVHSLMGLWLVLYLTYHLIVNSQAALWLGNDGGGFVRMVNSLESLPYLHVIESLFIGVPLFVHGIWGVKRALQPKLNTLPYARNRAFTWQRLTSWILLIGIIGHVVQMRFVYQPKLNDQKQYWVEVSSDDGLIALAERVGVHISDLENGDVMITAPNPGLAMLFMVRDTFKSPLMAVFYTLFVVAAAFHAFNGLWTALITWGAILSYRSQKAMLPIGWIGACVLSLLGLAAIWGSYWI